MHRAISAAEQLNVLQVSLPPLAAPYRLCAALDTSPRATAATILRTTCRRRSWRWRRGLTPASKARPSSGGTPSSSAGIAVGESVITCRC
jgi:hypothetical protein